MGRVFHLKSRSTLWCSHLGAAPAEMKALLPWGGQGQENLSEPWGWLRLWDSTAFPQGTTLHPGYLAGFCPWSSFGEEETLPLQSWLPGLACSTSKSVFVASKGGKNRVLWEPAAARTQGQVRGGAGAVAIPSKGWPKRAELATRGTKGVCDKATEKD